MANISYGIALDQKAELEIKEFFKAFPLVLPRVLRSVGIFGKKAIVSATPVKVGDARKSWTIKEPDPASVSIISEVGRGSRYTPFLESGTGLYGDKKKAYRVYPKGNALTFNIGKKKIIVLKEGFKTGRGYVGFREQKQERQTKSPIWSHKGFVEIKGFKGFGMVKRNTPLINRFLADKAQEVIGKLWQGLKLKADY